MADEDVSWWGCRSGEDVVGCNLDTHKFSEEQSDTEGVYIIWHDEDDPSNADNKIIYVGQGVISNRIEFHRGDDPPVCAYPKDKWTRRFCFAELDADVRDGVERYLADELEPKTGSDWPDVDPISVNLPSLLPRS